MKKKLLLGYLLLLFHVSSPAQTWNYYKDFPINVHISKADFDNNGNIYIVTANFEVWKKPINGSWQKLNLAVIAPRDILINKNTGHIFIATDNQGLYYTTNGGQTEQFAFMSTNPVSGFHEGIDNFSNINNQNVFYAGVLNPSNPLESFILKYLFQGSSISSIQVINYGGALAFNNFVNCIVQTSDGSTIVVGADSGVFTSTNGGTSFQPNAIGTKFYKLIQAQQDTFYALVNNNQGQNQVLKSVGGLNWTVYYNNIASDKLTEIFYDATNADLWIGTEKNLFKVDDTNSSTPILENKNLNNVEQHVIKFFVTNHNIHLFSAEYTSQKMSGNAWGQNISGFIGTSEKAFIGNNGKIHSYGTISSVFSQTNSENDPWINTMLPGEISYYISNMEADGTGNIYLTKKDKIYKINQQGAIQEINVSNPDQATFIHSLYVAKNGNIYIVFGLHESKLYRSTNGGQTWELFHEMTNTFDTFNSFCEDLQGNVYYTKGFNFAEFHYTTNNGATWNSHEIYNDGICGGSITGQLFEENGIPFFVACGTRNFIQINDGVQLTHVPYIDFNASFGDEPLIINQNGFYTTFDNVIYKSTNNGQTWQSMSSPAALNPYPNSIEILSSTDNEIFVKTRTDSFNLPTNLRGFYRLTENLGTDDLTTNILASISPNPATSFINIKSNTNIIGYELYEVTGKHLISDKLLNNFINVSHLSKGFYLLKLISAEGKTQIFKVLKDL